VSGANEYYLLKKKKKKKTPKKKLKYFIQSCGIATTEFTQLAN